MIPYRSGEVESGSTGYVRRSSYVKMAIPLWGTTLSINRAARGIVRHAKGLVRQWYVKNTDYNAERYAEKAGGVRLRFRWDGEEGRVVGMDLRKLKETDWVIAADFLKDVIRLAQSCYDDVLKAKYTDKGASYGG